MPLAPPSVSAAVGCLAWFAAALPLATGSNAAAGTGAGGGTDAPGGSDADPLKGLRTDVRSQTNGQTIGDVPTNMVLVPGGQVTMGIDEKTLNKLFENSDIRQCADHLIPLYPQHVEQSGDLLVDKFEASNIQFKLWMDAHNGTPSEDLIKWNWSSFKNGKQVQGIPPGQENNPIRAVSGDDAQSCAKWLGKRLPTAIEWEYFARRGLKPDQFFPWPGSGFAAWDPTKCANSANSSKGKQGPQTFAPGTWKEDVTVDGIFDVCGNATEWTTSPFVAYPGFQPLEIREGKAKRLVRGEFSSEKWTTRGGSFLGDLRSNNLVYRDSAASGSLYESVGFRCVMSAIPGADQLKNAEKALTILSADIKDRLDYDAGAIAGQVVQYVDPDTNLTRVGAKYVAFTRVTSILSPLMKVEHDSIEREVLLGVLTVSTPLSIRAPTGVATLPGGSYAICFKGKGLSAAQKLANDDAKKAEKEAKKDDDKKAKEEKKAKKDDRAKKSAKGDPKPADGGDAKPGEAKPGDAKPEGAAGDKPADPNAPTPEDEAAKKALEGIGAAKATRVSLAGIPSDISVILFKDETDSIVAWLPAKYVDGSAHHSTRFTYASGGGTSVKQASAGDSPMISTPRDTAKLVFTVKMGTSNKVPEFELPLEFEAGSFEPLPQ